MVLYGVVNRQRQIGRVFCAKPSSAWWFSSAIYPHPWCIMMLCESLPYIRWEWHKSLVAFQRLCQYMSSLDKCCPAKLLMSTCGQATWQQNWLIRKKMTMPKSTQIWSGYICLPRFQLGMRQKKGTNSSTKLVIVTIKPCIFWALKIVMIWCCTHDGVSPFWVFFILNFNPLHFPIHFLGVPQPKHESSVPKRLLWWHRCCWTGTHHLLETLQSLHDPAPLRSWNHWYVDLARSKKLIYHMWNPKPRSYINAQLLYIFHDFSGLHKSHSFEMLQDGLERCMAENW